MMRATLLGRERFGCATNYRRSAGRVTIQIPEEVRAVATNRSLGTVAGEKIVKLYYVVLAALVVAFAAPLTASADFIPRTSRPVRSTNWFFVTRDTRDATSPYVADYNSFVTQEAGQNINLPKGVSWDAIASNGGRHQHRLGDGGCQR